jgi:transcriptional regulator with XRE-family HTH domain
VVSTGELNMPDKISPTVRRRKLGVQLRTLRERAGLTIDDVARSTRWSMSKISRIETARVGARQKDVDQLLALYQVEDPDTRASMAQLVREAAQRGWWTTYGEAVPDWFEDYVGFESEASSFRIFETQIVPALLQTEDYARAILKAGRLTDLPYEVEQRIQLRMARQSVFSRSDPPRMRVVIDESVLRRPVGGPEVMAGQLKRLLAEVDNPNIILQVLPFSAGEHLAMNGSFVLFAFDESDLDIVYVEYLAGALYLEKKRELAWYTLAFDHLGATALGPKESAKLVEQALKELSNR